MSRRDSDLQPGAAPRLFASMDRAALDETLGGVRLTAGPGAAAEVLAQTPDRVDAIALALARIATALLPTAPVDALQAGALRRQLLPALPTFAHNVASALRLCAHSGAPLPPGPEPIAALMKKKGLYAGFRLVGMQVQNIALDQRQISGAFLVFLVDRAVGAIDRRYADSKVPQPARDRLLADFAPALFELDEVLRNPQLRKEQLATQRQALALQVEDAQADAQLAEASLRLRQKLVLPREVLFAAARRYMQKQAEAQGAAPAGTGGVGGAGGPPGAPAGTGGATGSGRIIR